LRKKFQISFIQSYYTDHDDPIIESDYIITAALLKDDF